MGENLTIISIIGKHAGEKANNIFDRKIKDIKRTGVTFWAFNSWGIKPEMMRRILRKAKIGEVKCIFIEPSVKGGAKPTKINSSAGFYSINKKQWRKLPKELSPVTGNINNGACALVFKKLKLINGKKIDLWDYADFGNPNKPIKFILGCSTICVTEKDMNQKYGRIKSRYRRMIAEGILNKPYCVYLR